MLDVLHKRPDGFHEVEMVMTMIDLADRLEMSEQKRDTIIITSQAGYIPLDEKNLAFQAKRLIKERYDVKQGVHIHLDKNSVAAGLAGGAVMRGNTARLEPTLGTGYPQEERRVGRRARLGCAVLRNGRHRTGYRARRGTHADPESAAVLGDRGEAADQCVDGGSVRTFAREQIQRHPSAERMVEALTQATSSRCANRWVTFWRR